MAGDQVGVLRQVVGQQGGQTLQAAGGGTAGPTAAVNRIAFSNTGQDSVLLLQPERLVIRLAYSGR